MVAMVVKKVKTSDLISRKHSAYHRAGTLSLEDPAAASGPPYAAAGLAELGRRIAMQGLGGKCLFSSEWESNAKETYYNNYGEVPFGDIMKFTNIGIPARAPS